MNEINLKLKWIYDNSIPGLQKQELDRSREPYLEEIKEKISKKENVFIKFSNKHPKRPGTIAKVYKVEDDPRYSYQHWSGIEYSSLLFYLKWDDRKNKAKIEINSENVVYLPDYQGGTVWSMFDPKAYAKENEEIVYDRLGKELTVGDIIVLINSRYGSGANLDFGVIREIKQKGKTDYRGHSYVDVTTIIETIAIDSDTPSQKCKIKRPERSIIKMTDVDLLDEAVMHKLRAV